MVLCKFCILFLGRMVAPRGIRKDKVVATIPGSHCVGNSYAMLGQVVYSVQSCIHFEKVIGRLAMIFRAVCGGSICFGKGFPCCAFNFRNSLDDE